MVGHSWICRCFWRLLCGTHNHGKREKYPCYVYGPDCHACLMRHIKIVSIPSNNATIDWSENTLSPKFCQRSSHLFSDRTMPAKVKVRIVAGRDLPIMDRSSELTDAFVEVRQLCTITHGCVCVCRGGGCMCPVWNLPNSQPVHDYCSDEILFCW